ncbi:hypothetical protein [Halomonas sp. WWR20]
MTSYDAPSASPPDQLDKLLAKLDQATADMAQTRDFAKHLRLGAVLDMTRRALMIEGGFAAIEQRVSALEAAGVFNGSDWAHPEILLPAMVPGTLRSGEPNTILLECLSELRMLAIARGAYQHPSIPQEQAQHFLTQVLALNLELLFTPPSEAERVQQGNLALLIRALYQYLAEGIGFDKIIDRLIDEVWRILEQRPIQVASIKQMITQIAICRARPDVELGTSGQGADRLISSLYGPTHASREDPGIDVYWERIGMMDSAALQHEAKGFARAMHDTGLVSPYHPILLRHLLDHGEHLLGEALGLSNTGRDCLLCYQQLVRTLIQEAVYSETAQAVFGLSLMLERGILYQPPVAPALWRQLSLVLSSQADARLRLGYGDSPPPKARLLEGVLCMLGLPLGVGQGNNPTCQSARALSMWAYNDPDYLLQIVAWAARDDEVVIHFEGQPISSQEAAAGLVTETSLDLDPVSLLVVPHLDRIYAEMGRRCADRGEDPHRWVNPEFHGWWAGRGFRIVVDVATGLLTQTEDFLRYFYASYHPYYNGNQPVIHPQPAGIAVTDSAARFVGWHAITLLRVSLDPHQVMRMYFYNPNNDSGQDWGNGVVVGTAGNGERFGEASLPFEQFVSRLYIFHYDPLEPGEPADVSREEIQTVMDMIQHSWGADRLQTALQADPGY